MCYAAFALIGHELRSERLLQVCGRAVFFKEISWIFPFFLSLSADRYLNTRHLLYLVPGIILNGTRRGVY